MVIDQLSLAAAEMLFYCNMSLRLYSREIKPNAGAITEKKSFLQLFKEMVKQKRGFGQKPYTADKQTCVCVAFSSFKIILYPI